MGRMAADTGVHFFAGYVIVDGKTSGTDLGMTFQAGIGIGRLAALLMAAPATLAEGFVKHVSEKAGSFTAVGIMAGQAVSKAGRVSLMTFSQFHQAVTGKTDFVGLGLEQLIMLRLVGTVAGKTFAPTVGLMTDLVSAFQPAVAFETRGLQFCSQQVFSTADMGLMTNQTLSFENRRMDLSSLNPPAHPGVAGITEARPLLIQ